jgi:hypothetical protein
MNNSRFQDTMLKLRPAPKRRKFSRGTGELFSTPNSQKRGQNIIYTGLKYRKSPRTLLLRNLFANSGLCRNAEGFRTWSRFGLLRRCFESYSIISYLRLHGYSVDHAPQIQRKSYVADYFAKNTTSSLGYLGSQYSSIPG